MGGARGVDLQLLGGVDDGENDRWMVDVGGWLMYTSVRRVD